MNSTARVFFRSLSGRLVFFGSGVLLVSLVIAWFGLSYLFEQHVEHRIQSELTNHLNQLIISVKEPIPNKFKLSKPLSDPRFRKPFSGLYWQVSDKNGAVLKSRSLWDFELDEGLNSRTADGLQEYVIAGPENSELFSVVQKVIVDAGAGEKFFLMTVSLDHAEISKAVDSFSYDLGFALIVLAMVLIVAILVQVSVGLTPLKQMQTEISELQSGERKSLTGAYPNEIIPIVEEINSFVSAQEIASERGRARAGDLAHGFKTPLSVLSAQARKLENAGQDDVVIVLRQQISIMNQHVERELARAKLQSIQPRTSHKTKVHTDINKLVATFTIGSGLDGREINWVVNVPKELFVQMDGGDFREVCGNILENASKWAKSKVRISAHVVEMRMILLEIEDDGVGVEESQMHEILQRGRRLDETVQGNGLGLAIVNDIMTAYSFSVEPFSSKLGGLGFRLLLKGGY